MSTRLNDATPADWDRLQKQFPAIEVQTRKTGLEAWAKPAEEEAASLNTECPVNSPSHYNQGGIECIEAIKASMTAEAFAGYLKGNMIKYSWRMALKEKTNPLEDLRKAQFYLARWVAEVEKG
jgi:hypothetical protein